MQEPYRYKNSRIHSANARVKVILTLAFILFLNLSPPKAWAATILFLTISLSAALLSRLGIWMVLKRALIAIPFTLAAVPLIFLGPGEHITLALAPNLQIAYSPEGLARFLSIFVKSWISVQAAVLLVSTTPFQKILNAMQQLKIPPLLISLTGMMWRYLFVLSAEARRLLNARASRSSRLAGATRSGGSLFWRARVTGGMAGSLFLRAIDRSERIYLAMLSRGYSGSFPAWEEETLAWRERAYILIGISILLLLWIFGLLITG